jgi:copper ion binding protein
MVAGGIRFRAGANPVVGSIPPGGIVLRMAEAISPSTTTRTVTGMTCGHCVAAVTAEVGRIDGVTAVDVELASGLVTVTSDGPLDDAAFAAAVDEAGYEVAS